MVLERGGQTILIKIQKLWQRTSWQPLANRIDRSYPSRCTRVGAGSGLFFSSSVYLNLCPVFMASKNPNRNIIRLDRETHGGGYLLRMTRKGELCSQYFVDDAYGGKTKALAAARKERDQWEESWKGFSSRELARKQRVNNTSGAVGVRLVKEKDPRWPSQPEYEYWVAQWSPKKGVRKSKRFSVKKYGSKKAFDLAVKARKKGVAEMEARK